MLCCPSALVCKSIYLAFTKFLLISVLLASRKRGLRGSFARQSLSGIVLLMLAASTVYVILGMKFYVMQIPSAMGQEPPPALVRKLLEYNIASNWMSRLNASIYLCLRVFTLTFVLFLDLLSSLFSVI